MPSLKRNTHKMRSLLRTILLAVAMMLVFATSAMGGSYKQYVCKKPDGSVAALDGMRPAPRPAMFVLSDDCSTGGAISIRMLDVGVPAGASGQWAWEAPADNSLQASRLQRACSLASVGSVAAPTWRVSSGLHQLETSGFGRAAGNLNVA